MSAVISAEQVLPALVGQREKMPFRSLHDDIYASLREALMTGELVPGQAVPIRMLAERFGTSIIPVRDALKRLVAEHALTMLPNRTVVVSAMTRRRFQEILTARLSLETMLARQAVEQITPATLLELDTVNEQMTAAADAGDVKRYLAANQRFHFCLYTAAQSTVILPMVQSLWMQMGPFLNGVFTASGTRNSHDNHENVIKAARRRDSAAVATAIHDDLADAADLVLTRTTFAADAAGHAGEPGPEPVASGGGPRRQRAAGLSGR